MMGQFETPITNPNLAEKLRGLDAQAIIISRNEELSARVDDFIETYAEPKTLDHITRGETHRYDHKRITALGRTGTLLHARMHEYPLSSVDTGLRNMVVIGSLYSPEPATIWTAQSKELTWGSVQSIETVLDVGSAPFVERGLRPVPDGMTEFEWEEQQELERLLEIETQREMRPQVRFGNNKPWTYRRTDGRLEPLRDLYDIQAKVNLARYRGLGRAAVEPAQQLTGTMEAHAEVAHN